MAIGEGGFPYFPRQIINPEGNLSRYRLLNYRESLQAVEEARNRGDITMGSASLVAGLLRYGGTHEFPGGPGLLYNHVLKHNFDTRAARPAIDEITEAISGKVNCILAPEHSSSIPAGIFSQALGDIPIFKIRKDSSNGKKAVGAQLDSYTGGGRDTLVFELDRLEDAVTMVKGRSLRALLLDDIIDAGSMTKAIYSITIQARELNFPLSVREIYAFLEKKFTGARRIIEKETGIKVRSGLVIEDMGLNPGWIKITGIDNLALSFYQKNIW